MMILRPIIAVYLLAGLALFCLGMAVKARAHDWYPIECCHALDCAPVTSTAWVAGATFEHGQRAQGVPLLVVTTKMGTGIVPADLPRRESQDNRMHACMRPGPLGQQAVICIFVPPGM